MTGGRLAAALRGSRLFNALLRGNPLYYGGVRRLLRRFDAADAAARQTMAMDLERRALGWARSTAYGAGRGALDSWPILEKAELRERPEDFRRHGLQASAATGGTSGTPLMLARSLRCIAAEQAFIDHILSPWGVSFGKSRIASLRGDNVKDPSDRTPPFGMPARGGRMLLLSSQHLGADTVNWYRDALAEFRPDMLWIYPSAGEALCRHLAASGSALRIPLVFSSSEVLHGPSRAFIAQTLGAEVIDMFGMAERVVQAVSTRPDSYVFHPLYGRVELLPLDERDDAGRAVVEIVATGYWNEAMPLVRYRTGDRALVPAEYNADDLAAAARGEKPVLAILGRDQDYLLSPRGEILVGIDHIPRNVGNLLHMQVVQTAADAVRFDLLTTAGFGSNDLEQVKSNVAQKLPADMSVEIRQVEALQRLRNGKVPFVIRNL